MGGGELNVLVNLLITTISRLTHRAAPAPEARGGGQLKVTPNQFVIALGLAAMCNVRYARAELVVVYAPRVLGGARPYSHSGPLRKQR